MRTFGFPTMIPDPAGAQPESLFWLVDSLCKCMLLLAVTGVICCSRYWDGYSWTCM